MNEKKISQLKLEDEASKVVFPGWQCKGEPIKHIKDNIDRIKQQHPDVNRFNGCIFTTTSYFRSPTGGGDDKLFVENNVYLFRNESFATSNIKASSEPSGDFGNTNARYNFDSITIKNKGDGLLLVTIRVDTANNITKITYNYSNTGSNYTLIPPRAETGYNKDLHNTKFSTVCFENLPEFKGWYPNNGEVKAYIDPLANYFYLERVCNGELTPVEGQPLPNLPQSEGGQTDNSSCSNTGQFGGGGKPLKDIKLSLFVNNVTKGNIKLSKPQLEVGTYATDWRPNPADATKSIEMMLKQIESGRKGGKKSGKKRD